MRLVLRSVPGKIKRREEMIGAQAPWSPSFPVGAEGMIRIHGELWRANLNQPCRKAAGPGDKKWMA